MNETEQIDCITIVLSIAAATIIMIAVLSASLFIAVFLSDWRPLGADAIKATSVYFYRF